MLSTFRIDDMTCGHCMATIAKAIKAVDAQADVRIDLDQHQVKISSAAGASTLESAIREAGYTPVAQAAALPAGQPSQRTAKAGGCGGGGCRCH